MAHVATPAQLHSNPAPLPSSPSLWAELPSLPGSIEAWSQHRRQQRQEEHQQVQLALQSLFEIEVQDNITFDPQGNCGATGPSSRASEIPPARTASVDAPVTSEPFDLFDAGSPWTQINHSTQLQRRVWLGKLVPLDAARIASGLDLTQLSGIPILASEADARPERSRPREKRKLSPRTSEKGSRAMKSLVTTELQKDSPATRLPKTRLAVELTDEEADDDAEEESPAEPSVSRPRRPRGTRKDIANFRQDTHPHLRHTSHSSLVREQGNLTKAQNVLSACGDAVQRPRPKPRASAARDTVALDAVSAQEQQDTTAALDDNDDGPSATQFFTRKRRRSPSRHREADEEEAKAAVASYPALRSRAEQTFAVTKEASTEVSASIEAAAVEEPVAMKATRISPNEGPAAAAEANTAQNDSNCSFFERTVSFGQLSKDDEDALESFVEGMDSEGDVDVLGDDAPPTRQTPAIATTSQSEVLQNDSQTQTQRRVGSSSDLVDAFTDDRSCSPAALSERTDEEDPASPSGLAPLLPELDAEKQRGYFAQFDSLVQGGGFGARSESRSNALAPWLSRGGEEEGVGVHWPETPSRRFGGGDSVAVNSRRLAGRGGTLGRADSDSRLLPNRFTGFSRPIVSCSQLLRQVDGDAGEGVDVDMGVDGEQDSPSLNRRGASAFRRTSSTTRTSTSVRTARSALAPRSRNPNGMGLVRKTWGSTWLHDGSRVVRGRIVRRTSPQAAPESTATAAARVGAIDPRKEREMWESSTFASTKASFERGPREGYSKVEAGNSRRRA